MIISQSFSPSRVAQVHSQAMGSLAPKVPCFFEWPWSMITWLVINISMKTT